MSSCLLPWCRGCVVVRACVTVVRWNIISFILTSVIVLSDVSSLIFHSCLVRMFSLLFFITIDFILILVEVYEMQG